MWKMCKVHLVFTVYFLLQGKKSNGALHWEEMSPCIHVLAYSFLLPGGDRCRICDQLHGSCCRQFSHAEWCGCISRSIFVCQGEWNDLVNYVYAKYFAIICVYAHVPARFCLGACACTHFCLCRCLQRNGQRIRLAGLGLRSWERWWMQYSLLHCASQ